MEQVASLLTFEWGENCLASDDFSDGKLPKAGEIWVFLLQRNDIEPRKT